jgi:hypothetical protein
MVVYLIEKNFFIDLEFKISQNLLPNQLFFTVLTSKSDSLGHLTLTPIWVC